MRVPDRGKDRFIAMRFGNLSPATMLRPLVFESTILVSEAELRDCYSSTEPHVLSEFPAPPCLAEKSLQGIRPGGVQAKQHIAYEGSTCLRDVQEHELVRN